MEGGRHPGQLVPQSRGREVQPVNALNMDLPFHSDNITKTLPTTNKKGSLTGSRSSCSVQCEVVCVRRAAIVAPPQVTVSLSTVLSQARSYEVNCWFRPLPVRTGVCHSIPIQNILCLLVVQPGLVCPCLGISQLEETARQLTAETSGPGSAWYRDTTRADTELGIQDWSWSWPWPWPWHGQNYLQSERMALYWTGIDI